MHVNEMQDRDGRTARRRGAIRLAAAAILAMLAAAIPCALLFAGMSVMAFDSGVSPRAMAVVGAIWGCTVLMPVAAGLAVVALFRPRWKWVLWAAALAAPMTGWVLLVLASG